MFIFLYSRTSLICFNSIQFTLVAQLCPTICTPWTEPCKASMSITISWSLLKFMSIESVMPSNRFILCRPLIFLISIFPSIRVFSSELAIHVRCPKYWRFSFCNSTSHEYSGSISFRIDCLHWGNLSLLLLKINLSLSTLTYLFSLGTYSTVIKTPSYIFNFFFSPNFFSLEFKIFRSLLTHLT